MMYTSGRFVLTIFAMGRLNGVMRIANSKRMLNQTTGTCCLYEDSMKFDYKSGACHASAILTEFNQESCRRLRDMDICNTELDAPTAEDCYAAVLSAMKLDEKPDPPPGEPKDCCCKELPSEKCEYNVVEDDGKTLCCKERDGGCPWLSWYNERKHPFCGLPEKPAVLKPIACYTCRKGQGMSKQPRGTCTTGSTRGGTTEIFKRHVTEECRGLYKVDCEENPLCKLSSYGRCVGLNDESLDTKTCSNHNTRSLPGRYHFFGCMTVKAACP